MDHAAFLRGVNVGGIKVESKKLKTVLEGLGLEDVTTYLASGNVTFSSSSAASRLQALIEKALSKEFSYDAHVLIYSRKELAGIVSDYPFRESPDHHRYAILCDAAATAKELAGQAGDEEVTAKGTVVYWKCPKGSTLQTPFGKVLAKRAYKEKTTTRNLNTVEKML